jgi:hypothetical protein
MVAVQGPDYYGPPLTRLFIHSTICVAGILVSSKMFLGVAENFKYLIIIPGALCYKPEDRRFECRMRLNFSNLTNPSSRTMDLGSTQLLTKMSTRNLPGGKKQPARYADNLVAICEPNV